jgi:hypothetical protein
MRQPVLKADVMRAAAHPAPADPPRTERELQLRDYLITFGQARAAGVDAAEALHMAEVTSRGMALVRAHDAAVLDLKQ